MSIKLGNTAINKLYLGSGEISKAYLGNTLVYAVVPPNPIPQENLIVDLNADTMFTTGDVLATSGQVITNWANSITGNGVSGATQSDNSRRPLLQLESGIKAIKFDGSNDFLNFFRPPELDFQKTDDFTISVMTGTSIASGYMVSKGLSYPKQYAMWFASSGATVIDVFGSDGPGFGSLPSSPQLTTMVYTSVDDTLKLYINAALVGSVTGTPAYLYPMLDTLIGARHGSTANNTYGFYYGGSLRRLLMWQKALSLTEIDTMYNEVFNI